MSISDWTLKQVHITRYESNLEKQCKLMNQLDNTILKIKYQYLLTLMLVPFESHWPETDISTVSLGRTRKKHPKAICVGDTISIINKTLISYIFFIIKKQMNKYEVFQDISTRILKPTLRSKKLTTPLKKRSS